MMQKMLTLALAIALTAVVGFLSLDFATAAQTQPAAGPPAATAKIDLNTASREDLVNVPGVGPYLADAILALRVRKSTFAKLEDLLEVRGIKVKKLKALSKYLSVQPPGAAVQTPAAR
jgi:competence ComEA-like helix-hairpin-helix protein